MSLKNLLVHVDSTPRSAERLDLAVALARRCSARLTGLFAEVDQLGPSLVARRDPSSVRAAREAARAAFAERAGAAGLTTEWWQIEARAYGEILDLVVTCCRYVDLVILGQHDRENERVPKDLVEYVMLDSGRPLVVVPSVGHYADLGRRILVGWNATPEAARAVNDALPLLESADSVRVVRFQRHARAELAGPPTDLLVHLAAHGVRAALETTVDAAEGESVVNALLNQSFDSQADLLVMAGNGERFPLPHAMGSTRDILRSMATPVFLSH